MPPPESNRQLATGERETLRQWIADGASYGTHWAFKSLAKVNPAPVDDFIREKLSTSGLSLSPEAPSATIIRRIHLGLTGLPASPTISPNGKKGSPVAAAVPSRNLSIPCWQAPTTGSIGRAGGSISPATRTAPDTRETPICPMPTNTGIS